MADVLTMRVEFRKIANDRIEVRTDGSLMGTYDDYEIAGRDLGDEFKHRMEQQ
jgi:hypothetical protein